MPVVLNICKNKKKQIIKILRSKGIKVIETSFDEYIIVLQEDKNFMKDIFFLSRYCYQTTPVSYSEAMKLTKTVNETPKIIVGDVVKIRNGAFEGMTGIIKNIYQDNATVATTCLGIQTDIDIKINDCEKI